MCLSLLGRLSSCLKRASPSKYFVIIAAMTGVLVEAIALATTDSAFAGKKEEYSQATAQVNNCGNGEFPDEVFCQNLASQVQGDENSAALADPSPPFLICFMKMID